MRFTLSLATSAVIALATLPATAQDLGLYGHIFGGYSGIDDPNFTGAVGGAPQSVGTEFDGGYNLGIAVGKTIPGLGSGNVSFRGEAELSFGTGDVDRVFFSGNGPAAEVNVGGDISTTRIFGNLIADFETGGKFTPYAGLGLGIARTDIDIVYGPGVRLDDSSENFSAQLILGSAYELSDTLSLTGDVRYIRDFGVATPRFSGAGALTGTVEDDIDTLNVNVGLRFGF